MSTIECCRTERGSYKFVHMLVSATQIVSSISRQRAWYYKLCDNECLKMLRYSLECGTSSFSSSATSCNFIPSNNVTSSYSPRRIKLSISHHKEHHVYLSSSIRVHFMTLSINQLRCQLSRLGIELRVKGSTEYFHKRSMVYVEFRKIVVPTFGGRFRCNSVLRYFQRNSGIKCVDKLLIS
jgi:hypothetical protein